MIDNSDDVKWVRAQRPSVAPPDAETTMWARAAVLAHAQKSAELKGLDARPERLAKPSTRRRLAGFLKARRGMAAAAAVALVALAGIGVTVAGVPHAAHNGLAEEVAEALGIPVGTVRFRISRARLRLRAQLAELGCEREGAEPQPAR